MLNRLLVTIAATFFLAAGAAAQEQPKPVEQKPAAEQKAPAPPRPSGTIANVRIELTISDQTGPGANSKKVVTMMVADGSSSSIRTSGWVMTKEGRQDVRIDVDARPQIVPNRENTVRLDLGIQYQPTSSEPAGDASKSPFARYAQTGLNQRILTILESGKPLVISEAADPASDRRISVEVRATIVR